MLISNTLWFKNNGDTLWSDDTAKYIKGVIPVFRKLENG